MRYRSIHELIEKGRFDIAQSRINDLPAAEGQILKNEILEKQAKYQELLQNLSLQTIKESEQDYVRYGKQYQQSVVYFRMGELGQAEHEVLELFEMVEREDPNRDDIDYWLINGRNLIASLYAMKGNWEKARTYFQKAIDLTEERDYQPKLGTLYNNMAATEGYAGNYNKALNLDKIALKIYEEQGFDRFIAISKGNMAEIHIIKGELSQAKTLLTEAIEVLNQLNTYDGLSDNLIKLGIIYLYQSNFTSALQQLKRANFVAQKNQNPFYLSLSYYYLILCTLEMGEKEEAEEYLKKFERLDKTSEEELTHSRYLLSKGAYFRRTGQYTEAIECFQKSSEDVDVSIRLQAIYHETLAHVEIIKRGLKGETSMGKIGDLIALIKRIAEELNSPFLKIQYYILRSQLNLLELRTNETFQELEKAKELAVLHNLDKFVDDIEQIENDLEKFSFLEEGSSNELNLQERIRHSVIEYYIQKMIKLDISK